jgi:integrase
MSVKPRPGSPYFWYTFNLDGVRFRGSTKRTTRREALIVEAEVRAQAARRTTPRAAWRLRDAFGAYWQEHGKHQRSSAFLFTKLEALSRLLGPDTVVTELTNAQLLDYRARRRGEGLQPQTVNRDLAVLKAALNHANQLHGQALPALAWKRIRAPEPQHRTRFLQQAEFAALIQACDPALALIVRFAVATGLRKANVLELDWGELDLAAGLVTVTVKGNKRHSLRLTPELRAALARTGSRSGPVFDTRNIRRRWQRAVKTAGLADFRFHDLRHTFASWARIAGADLADIREALAHSSVAVTMRYAHIAPDHPVSALDRVSHAVWSHSASQSPRRNRK